MKFSPTRTDPKIAISSPDIPDIEWTGPDRYQDRRQQICESSIPSIILHCTKSCNFANSKPSKYRPVNQLITLMGEMNQTIIHSTNKIGSTLLNNNAASVSDVSEWFLEWFWSYQLLCLRLLFIVPISFIRWCILFHCNQNLAPDRKKKYPHREKTTPFPTRPVFLTPDRTDPRFKQNMAPWPESGRGCTVRSGNPRRSGVPRSSLLQIRLHSLIFYCLLMILQFYTQVLILLVKYRWLTGSLQKSATGLKPINYLLMLQKQIIW